MTDDLRRRIAERLGWRIVQRANGPDGVQWFEVYAPDGQPRLRETAYQAVNEWPAYDLDEAYPDWPGDANAALALPIPPGYGWVLFRLGENDHARLTTTGEVMRTAREAWSPDGVAAAIAVAWDQWMDAAKGEG